MTALEPVAEQEAPAPALRAAVQRIAREVAATHADAVDREGRFPAEAIDALRAAGAMAALVPRELGGPGCSIADVVEHCIELGRVCASTAMTYAMHQIEVAVLVRHALHQPLLRDYLERLVESQWLIASATSEVGIGGDLRRSGCALTVHDGRVQVTKQASVMSYGAHCDAILLTARRHPDAAPNDQQMLLAPRHDCTLTPTSEWNALGFRGTGSGGFVIDVATDAGFVLDAPFADIAPRTMVPVSHLFWGGLWVGMAEGAVDRARLFVRAEARKQPGTTPPSATRLAEAVSTLHTLRALLQDALRDFSGRTIDDDGLGRLGYTIRINVLKLEGTQLLRRAVEQALSVVGLAGYRLDTPYAMGRVLRDAFGAALMVHNDRVLATNAALLVAAREE